MDGTIGEIRVFAANFAPKSWAACEGQLLPIRNYTALFSILGTYYGGDGRITFALPDLRGRVALGAGQSQGTGSSYYIGEMEGTETVALSAAEMPSHTHTARLSVGTATLYGVNARGGQGIPGGHYLAADNSGIATPYAASGTPVAMHAGAITLTDASVPLPTSVTLADVGDSYPHTNIQPSLVLYYIICLEGGFPRRS